MNVPTNASVTLRIEEYDVTVSLHSVDRDDPDYDVLHIQNDDGRYIEPDDSDITEYDIAAAVDAYLIEREMTGGFND